MAQVSTARKIGIAMNVAGKMAARSRYVRAGWSAARATLGAFGRTARLLFLEVTGVLFLGFAAVGVVAAVHEYPKWAVRHEGPERFVIAVLFTLVFAWFGVSSFWRARS